MVLPERLIILLLLLTISGLVTDPLSFGEMLGAENLGEFGREVLFADDFSSTTTGWDRENYGYATTDYADGVYRIELLTDEYIAWAGPYVDLTDVIIEVEAYKASGGDDNGYGIICRHEDVNNFYFLEVSSDGYAWIGKMYRGEFEALESRTTDALNLGEGLNYLHVECIGSYLALYANGSLLLETFDSDLTHGDVGLIAETYSSETTEIIFDNFIVIGP